MLGREVIVSVKKKKGKIMNGRVGGKQVRRKREDRKRQILDVVKWQTEINGFATCTSVAKRIGLVPSTHLMNMLYELWDAHEIDGEWIVNSKGNRVLQWEAEYGEV